LFNKKTYFGKKGAGSGCGPIRREALLRQDKAKLIKGEERLRRGSMEK
jgi:hypothetical protein